MSSQEHPLGISFEFFPPNTDAGREKLIHVRDELAARHPRFFSVTYGQGAPPRRALEISSGPSAKAALPRLRIFPVLAARKPSFVICLPSTAKKGSIVS